MIRPNYGDESADKFKGSKNWLRRFVKRNNISLRRRTNKKRIGNEDKLPVIKKFQIQNGDAGILQSASMLTKCHVLSLLIKVQLMKRKDLPMFGLHSQEADSIKGNALYNYAFVLKTTS